MDDKFITNDTKLAAYLCFRGYDAPVFLHEEKTIKYQFSGVIQQDVLDFYNKAHVVISPLALFEKRDELIARSKIVLLGICTETFEKIK